MWMNHISDRINVQFNYLAVLLDQFLLSRLVDRLGLFELWENDDDLPVIHIVTIFQTEKLSILWKQ